MKKIALAVGDPGLASVLTEHLSRHGYAAIETTTGSSLLELAQAGEPTAIVLALAIENRSGLDRLKEIRAVSDVPVILLNDPGNDIDCFVGLELGADDCVKKPVDPRIIVARLHAVLRRYRDTCPRGATCLATAGTTASFSGWTFDAVDKRLISPSGRNVQLSVSETRLIEAFLRYPQKVLRREDLLHALGRSPATTRDDCITIHVSRLRRKLEGETRTLPVIKTEHGQGYILEEAVAWRKDPSKHPQAARCPGYACA